MNKLRAFLFLSLSCLSGLALATEQGLQIEASVWHAGTEFEVPTIKGKFDTWISTEIAKMVRIEAMATPPDAEGYAQTTIKMYVYRSGKMTFVRTMTGKLKLSGTPFFAYLSPQTGVRFMVQPRLASIR